MRKLLTLILVFIGFIVNSQVTVDLSFNPIDTVSSSFLGARGAVFAQAIQSDGKILVGGSMTGYNGYQSTTAGNLIRLNADGSRDASFGVANGANSTITAIAIQSDGKIIIGGQFTTYSGITVNKICRLNTNGSFDPSFNPGLGFGTVSTEIKAIKVLADGKIMIGGRFATYNGNAVNGICRINTNGSHDNTFNNGGTGFINGFINSPSPATINAIDNQTDGKIIVGGAFSAYNGINRSGLIRLSPDGSIDATFTLNNVNPGVISVIKVRSDNKIWIGGTSLFATNNLSSVGVLLLNTDGTSDASFSQTSSAGFSGTVYTITLIGTNKLFIAGSFTSYQGVSRTNLAIVNSNGSLDATVLSTSIYPIGSEIYCSNLDASNNIIYSGNFNNSITQRNNNVEKLTSSFNIDVIFNPTFGADGTVKIFATQPDGKIIIGGAFASYNMAGRSRIARLTVNGELDNTFTVGTGLNNDVNDIAIQTNGNIIAVGNFTNYNTTNVNRIVRIDATGAIDAAFATNIGTGANGEINTIALQSDGKIIIGGNFTSFNGNTSNYIARLNANGTFDNTFNIGTGAFGLIRVIRIQSDGKILLGGDFQFFNGVAAGRVLRLNSDGTTDNTFNTGGSGANGSIYDIVVASNGSIWVAGEMSVYNGVFCSTLIKLTSLGSRDFSFTPNAIGYAYFVNLYDNGKVLVGMGQDLGGLANALVWLNSNGIIDTTIFNLNGIISKGKLLGNGNKILLAGSFTSVRNVNRNRIARITDASVVALPVSLQLFTGSLENGNSVLNWNTRNEINTDQFIIERSINNITFNSVGTITAKGNTINNYQFTDFNISNLGAATTIYYRLKMQDKNGSFTYSATVPIKLSLKASITLLPNPAKNTVWLQIQQNITEKININISDISGKIFMQQNSTITSGTTVIPLEVSQLAAGVYFVTIKGNNKLETLKLVKE